MNTIPPRQALELLDRSALTDVIHEGDRHVPEQQRRLAFAKRRLRALDRAETKRAARAGAGIAVDNGAVPEVLTAEGPGE